MFIIHNLIDLRRKAVKKQFDNEIIDNGELPEDIPLLFKRVQTKIPFNFISIVTKKKFKLSTILSLSQLIEKTFSDKSEDESSRESNIQILKQSFATRASNRSDVPKPQFGQNTTQFRTRINLFTENRKPKLTMKISHNSMSFRDIEEQSVPKLMKINSSNRASPFAPRISLINSKVKYSEGPSDDLSLSYESDTEITELRETKQKAFAMSTLPSKADFSINEQLGDLNKYQNYK